MSMLTEQDIYLFREGTHAALYRKLGCHLRPDAAAARAFACGRRTRAPSRCRRLERLEARRRRAHAALGPVRHLGGDVDGVKRGQTYKYSITNAHGHVEDRADPFAFHTEVPPHTASRAWSLEYEWDDEDMDAHAPRAQRVRGAASTMSCTSARGGARRRTAADLPRDRRAARRIRAHDRASRTWS
jgi:1,4-alpha-glucan branching enzyme